MPDTKAYDEPLSVEICEGEIVVRAPSGPFGVSLTASAAGETADRLADAVRTLSGDRAGDQLSQTTGERD